MFFINDYDSKSAHSKDIMNQKNTVKYIIDNPKNIYY